MLMGFLIRESDIVVLNIICWMSTLSLFIFQTMMFSEPSKRNADRYVQLCKIYVLD